MKRGRERKGKYNTCSKLAPNLLLNQVLLLLTTSGCWHSLSLSTSSAAPHPQLVVPAECIKLLGASELNYAMVRLLYKEVSVQLLLMLVVTPLSCNAVTHHLQDADAQQHEHSLQPPGTPSLLWSGSGACAGHL